MRFAITANPRITSAMEAAKEKAEQLGYMAYLIGCRTGTTDDKIKALGLDVREAEPGPGNIEAGLTTLAEKSLGFQDVGTSRGNWGQKVGYSMMGEPEGTARPGPSRQDGFIMHGFTSRIIRCIKILIISQTSAVDNGELIL